MDDKTEPLPWDYFLTDYERDLLRLPIEEVARKYASMSINQIQLDRAELENAVGNIHENNTE